MQYDWDWAGAEKEFRRAIQLRPSDDLGQRLYGWLLIAVGRFPEAQAEMRRPLEAEPTNDFNLMELGLSYCFARQYEPALEQCRREIAVDPTSYWSHMLLGWTYEQEKEFPAAIEAMLQANRLNDTSQVIASLGHAYAVAGRRGEAERVIRELRKKSERKYISPYDIATIYAGLGDKEQTLIWLGKAYEDRSGCLALWLKVDPKFDALRSDPRFQDLLRRVGFTPS
jgi:tetratricopeptide (TPR) repeat protein